MAIIFNKLALTNFKIFRDSTVEFASKPDFTLITGDNSAGKTSLLDALRWVWYGTVRNRLDIAVDNETLINLAAIKDGENTCKVALEFSSDNTTYEIIRQYTKGESESAFTIHENGNTINAQVGQERLKQMMPETVSKFFLFDGEQLSKYEELMSSTQTQWLITEIRTILGLPAIDNSHKHISDLKAKANKALSNLDTNNNQYKIKQQQRLEIEGDIEGLEYKRDSMEEKLKELNEEKNVLEQTMQKHKEVQNKINERDKILKDLGTNKENMKKLRDEIQESSQELWTDVLTDSVASALKTKTEQLKQLQEIRLENARNEALEHLITSHESLETVVENFITAHIKTVPDSEGNLDSQIVHLQDTIQTLTNFKSGGNLGNITSKEEQIADLKFIITTQDQHIVDLNSFISEAQEEQITEGETSIKTVDKQIGVAEGTISELNTEIEQKQEILNDLDTELLGYNDDDPTFRKAQQLSKYYTELESIFAIAKQQMVENIRGDIETTATEYFMNLMENKNYSKLLINERFGLSILDNNEQVVPMRSSGQEQMVSLALLSALNKNAVVEAPLVLDTGFGRLDETRTRNSINHLRELSSQAVLLVHDAEVSIPIRDDIRKFVGKEYIIEKQLGSEVSFIKSI